MNEIKNTLSSDGTYSEWVEIKNIVENELIDFPITCYGIDVDEKNKKLTFETKRDHFTESQMRMLSSFFPSTLFCLETEDESGRYKHTQYFCDGELCTENKAEKNREKALKRENKRFLKSDKKGISLGVIHKAGIMHNGKVATYGKNYWEQCGVFSWEDVSKVSCGDFHTVALKKDGTVVACGSNANKQRNIATVAEKVIDVSCGRHHTAVLLESGQVQLLGNLEKTDTAYTHTPIEDWISVVRIKSVFDAVLGLTSDNQILIYGYCTLTDEEIKKALKIKS